MEAIINKFLKAIMKRFDFDSIKLDEGMETRETFYKNLRTNLLFKRQFTNALNLLLEVVENEKKILIFGNGGSAAEAQHFAGELVCQFQKKRRAVAAIALTTDSSILTAQSNDYEFETVFSRQIEALCRPGDVVVGLTTSDARMSDTWHGHSCNILRAFEKASTREARSIGFFSIKTKELLLWTDISIVVPHRDTAIIQEVHQMIIHELCRHIEEAL